jgi:hypothetical protein
VKLLISMVFLISIVVLISRSPDGSCRAARHAYP